MRIREGRLPGVLPTSTRRREAMRCLTIVPMWLSNVLGTLCMAP